MKVTYEISVRESLAVCYIITAVLSVREKEQANLAV